MNRVQLPILDALQIDINITENPLEFSLEHLFRMAARNNPKRAFLFVSTVLGKHIPVHPTVPMLAGKLLSYLMAEKLNEVVEVDYKMLSEALKDPSKLSKAYELAKNNPIYLQTSTLFIGFAETATALGHSAFSQCKGKACYIHTTRDELIEYDSIFYCVEEHSHATDHFCYPIHHGNIKDYDRVVLVDDEITTGNTALNLIRSIHQTSPKKEYVILSLLDWRTKEHRQKFAQLEQELGVPIHTVSLIQGEFLCEGKSHTADICFLNDIECEETSIKIQQKKLDHPSSFERSYIRKLSDAENKHFGYSLFTGRYGVSADEQEKLEQWAEKIFPSITPRGEKVLMLGTEEFMYIPMLLASYYPNIRYQSTTRSPIHPCQSENYGIQTAVKFINPYDQQIINYFYNIEPGYYDEVIIMTERKLTAEAKEVLENIFKKLNIEYLTWVYLVA